MLWAIEFRKNLPLFVTLIFGTLLAGFAATLFQDVSVFSVIQALGSLLCWSAATIYSGSVIFRYIALGDDLLMHIGSVNQWRIVWMKATVLMAYLSLLHLVSLMFVFKKVNDAAQGTFWAATAYMFSGKLLSIMTFLTLCVLLSALVKIFRTKPVVVAGFCVLIAAVVIGQTILLWRIGAPDTSHFFIGVGGEFFTVNLYANILPIILTDASAGMLPNIWVTSVTLNTTFLFIFLLIWAGVAKNVKVNFLKL